MGAEGRTRAIGQQVQGVHAMQSGQLRQYFGKGIWADLRQQAFEQAWTILV